MKSKLSKRLRKKNRVGDFQQFGFTILVKLKEITDDCIFTNEVVKIIDPENLCFAGGGGKNYTELAMCDRGRKNTVTPDKIFRIISKIKLLDGVEAIESFPLVDAWHSSEETFNKEKILIEEAKLRLGITK